MKNIEIRAERSIHRRSVDLYIRQGNSFCKDLIMENVEDGMSPPQTPLSLSHQEAQILINELWRVGFRPEGSESTKDQIDAMNNHLQDIRKIAFDKLKIKMFE